MRRMRRLLVVLVIVLASGCGGAGSGALDEAAPADSGIQELGGAEAEAPPAPARGAPAVPALPVAAQADRVVKDGTIALGIAEGTFDQAFAQVAAAAARNGGSVTASTSSRDGDGPTAGTVTLRVPVDSYEGLVVAVAELGEVRSRRINSRDVGVEYVDLQGRLRNAEAQQRFYLGLIDRARGVGDAIAIQQQLATIQSEIEQLRGRIQFLDQRTAFSTLTVELSEPGAGVPTSGPAGAPRLAMYWAQAKGAFVTVVGVLLVTGFGAAPVVVPLALALLAWWLARRRAAPVATAATPRAETPVNGGRPA